MTRSIAIAVLTSFFVPTFPCKCWSTISSPAMSLKDKYQVTNVFISAVTPDNISRMSLLSWVNDCLQSQLNKIEEMSTGAAYCQLTDRLFPGSVPLKKVKWNSRNDTDWVNNWRVLQKAWGDLGIDKPINVLTLMRAKFQDNFEFLQWFKKFYDANDAGYEYDALAARGGEQFPVSAGRPGARAPPARTVAPPTRRSPAVAATTRPVSKATPPAAARPATTSARPVRSAANGVDAKAEAAYKEEITQLKDQLQTYEKEVTSLSDERDFYYNRLRLVEELCQQIGEENSVPVGKVLAILYKKVSPGCVFLEYRASLELSDDELSTDDFEQVEHEVVDHCDQSNATETLDRSESAAALDSHQEVNGNDANGTHDIVEPANETVGEFESAVGVEGLKLEETPEKPKEPEAAQPEPAPIKANGDVHGPEEF
uniref:Microtubule-associated protein RP/EB family member 1 n=1 Tax=Bursaphelenchus xylophilus TaxID=6326 RepID=A0A1I7RLN5_BURXY